MGHRINRKAGFRKEPEEQGREKRVLRSTGFRIVMIVVAGAGVAAMALITMVFYYHTTGVLVLIQLKWKTKQNKTLKNVFVLH